MIENDPPTSQSYTISLRTGSSLTKRTCNENPRNFVGALLRPATLTTRGRLSASGALRALVGLAKRAARFTPALVGHGVRTALGCHCRGADCASRSVILPTAVPVRGVLAPASPTGTLCTRSSGAAALRLLDGTEAAARKAGCARYGATALACIALLVLRG